MNIMTIVPRIKRAVKEKGIAGFARAAVGRLRSLGTPHVDENEIIHKLFDGMRDGVMIDVGACKGETLTPFAKDGWQVFAFEPDPKNREVLNNRIGHNSKIVVSSDAVTEVDGQNLTLYGSEVSVGISSLSKFTEGHKAVATVKTTRLDSFVKNHGITNVDYLKVDAEGHDFFVLKSFAFGLHSPKIIQCEFENKKTIPLGYTVVEMARYLEKFGYTIFVSEWQPIVQYGIRHKWRRFIKDPSQVAEEGWGNLIAIKDDRLKAKAQKFLKLSD
jgi:FkbM family methyltransferase